MKIQIAIADDNILVLESIKTKLSGQEDLSIVLTAINGIDLLQKIQGVSVDIILMDIEMPGMNGIEATAELVSRMPATKIIMLTTFDDDERIFQSILAGASGYLLKEESGLELSQAIRLAHTGGAVMSASIALKALQYIRLAEQDRSRPAAGPGDCLLTAREIELLEHLKDGLGYKQIGAALQISEGTVRKHLERIYRKLQVNNKVSAINAASRKNWI